MAIQSANTHSDMAKLKEGVELTLRSLSSILERNGVEKISIDKGFDPNIHQAVMKVDGGNNIQTGEIVAILQNGYKLKDRLLRPTMVSVAN
jgi:molecular chaperone GrpE